jgi:hypothetical protein
MQLPDHGEDDSAGPNANRMLDHQRCQLLSIDQHYTPGNTANIAGCLGRES